MRLLILFPLAGFMGLAACTTRDYHAGITHFAPGQDGRLKSAKSRAINKLIAGRQCLPLDAVVREITKDNTKYTIVTTDIDVGRLQTGFGANGCLNFQALNDPSARAAVAFDSAHVEPRLETSPGNTIDASESVGEALSVASQDGCSSATFNKGDFEEPLAVMCKSGRQLTLKGTTPTGPVIYSYTQDLNSLRIVKYAPVELKNNCTSSIFKGQVTRVTTVVTWDDAPKTLSITRSFADLIAKSLSTKNNELDVSLAPTPAKGGKALPASLDVALSPSTLTTLYPTVANSPSLDGAFKAQLTCPTNPTP